MILEYDPQQFQEEEDCCKEVAAKEVGGWKEISY